eukprot:GILJ01012048.1.p1 GENE.GILJ01012048.1~~GILJ01012048.1.p1  ORF type:complete len:2113 (+),score=435.57 GILJ01012048.1:1-6339(+)
MNVRVAVRVRPVLPKEKAEKCAECVRVLEGNQVVIGANRSFTFDYAFQHNSSQSRIYEQTVRNLVDGCFEGYNATVLAYGQTGSGKTFTMGTGNGYGISDDEMGIIPRVIRQIFETIQQKKGTAHFLVRVSYLEIYNEDVKDLLHPETPSKSIAIREDANGGILVVGVQEEAVNSFDEMMSCLENGSVHRTTGSTLMNEQSSRSHSIFTVVLEQKHIDGTSDEYMSAKFHLVDLAGSERAKRTGAVGFRFKESVAINCGLLALGNVISALGDEKKKGAHIPYRESKLTRLLQDSLGGNSRTLMIACVSPADINFEETLNTLKYASRARNIKNKPVVNRDPLSAQLADLRQQVFELQQELRRYKLAEHAGLAADVSAGVKVPSPSTPRGGTQDRLSISMSPAPPLHGSLLGISSTQEALEQASAAAKAKIQTLEERVRELQAKCISFESSIGEATQRAFEAESSRDLLRMKLEEAQTRLGEPISEGVVEDGVEQSLISDYLKKIESLRSELMNREAKELQLSMELNEWKEKYQKDEEMLSAKFQEVEALTRAQNRLKRDHSRLLRQSRSALVASDPGTSSTDDLNAIPAASLDQPEHEDGGEGGLDADMAVADDDLDAQRQLSTEEIAYQEGQAHLERSLKEVSGSIMVKEELLQQLTKGHAQLQVLKASYTDKIRDLEHQVKEVERERDRVLEDLSKQMHGEDNKVKTRKEFETKLKALEVELRGYRQRDRDQARLVRLKQQNEQRMQGLQADLLRMKQTKVQLQKKMKEEADRFREYQQKRTKELAQLKRAEQKNQQQIQKLTQQAERHKLVMKRKAEEIAAAHRRIHQMSRQQTGLSGTFPGVAAVAPPSTASVTAALFGGSQVLKLASDTSSSMNQEDTDGTPKGDTTAATFDVGSDVNSSLVSTRKRNRGVDRGAREGARGKKQQQAGGTVEYDSDEVREWLEDATSRCMLTKDAHTQLQVEHEKRNSLMDQLKDMSRLKAKSLLRRERGETDEREAEDEELNERIESLEAELDYKTARMAELQTILLQQDGVEKFRSKLGVIKTVPEAHTVLRVAFDKVVDAKAREAQLQAKVAELEVSVEEGKNALLEGERRVQLMELEQERRLVQVQREYEEKALFLLDQLPQAHVDNGEITAMTVESEANKSSRAITESNESELNRLKQEQIRILREQNLSLLESQANLETRLAEISDLRDREKKELVRATEDNKRLQTQLTALVKKMEGVRHISTAKETSKKKRAALPVAADSLDDDSVRAPMHAWESEVDSTHAETNAHRHVVSSVSAPSSPRLASTHRSQPTSQSTSHSPQPKQPPELESLPPLGGGNKGDVFRRLTDVKAYTGMYRERAKVPGQQQQQQQPPMHTGTAAPGPLPSPNQTPTAAGTTGTAGTKGKPFASSTSNLLANSTASDIHLHPNTNAKAATAPSQAKVVVHRQEPLLSSGDAADRRRHSSEQQQQRLGVGVMNRGKQVSMNRLRLSLEDVIPSDLHTHPAEADDDVRSVKSEDLTAGTMGSSRASDFGAEEPARHKREHLSFGSSASDTPPLSPQLDPLPVPLPTPTAATGPSVFDRLTADIKKHHTAPEPNQLPGSVTVRSRKDSAKKNRDPVHRARQASLTDLPVTTETSEVQHSKSETTLESPVSVPSASPVGSGATADEGSGSQPNSLMNSLSRDQSWRTGSVFDRLTRVESYTGMYRERFMGDSIPAGGKNSLLHASFEGGEGPWECSHVQEAHNGFVCSVAVGDDMVFTASHKSVKVWDIATWQEKAEWLGHKGFVRCLQTVDDRHLLVTASQKNIKIFDWRTNECVANLSGHTAEVRSLWYSSSEGSSGHLYTAGDDNTVRVWELSGMRCVKTVQAYSVAVFAMFVDPAHNLLYTGGRDHNIKAWDATTMEWKASFHPPHYDAVTSFTVFGNTLVSGSRDKNLRRWKLDTFEPIHTTLNAHQDWVNALAVSGDGQELFSGSKDGLIRIWKTQTDSDAALECVADLKGHASSVNALSMSRCSSGQQFLVSASNDKTVRIWRKTPEGMSVPKPKTQPKQEPVDSMRTADADLESSSIQYEGLALQGGSQFDSTNVPQQEYMSILSRQVSDGTPTSPSQGGVDLTVEDVSLDA